MTKIKKYTLKDGWKDWEIALEVDHDVLTKERATIINEFWSDSADRVYEADGCVVMAVIRLAAERFIYAFLEMGGAFIRTDAVAKHYTRTDLHEQEGWGGTVENSLFGWCGIRLISADVQVDLQLEFEKRGVM